jgi:hypothetical protein
MSAPEVLEGIPDRSTSASRPPFSVEVVAWRPLERGSLLGFTEIVIPQLKLHIADITVHQHESGKRWCGMPGKPRLDKDHNVIRAASGKPEYSKVIWFADRRVADAFGARVVEALDAYLARVGAA